MENRSCGDKNMARKLRAVKSCFVFGILLMSLSITVVPSTSAGLLLNLQSVITVEWEANQTADPVLPRGELRPVNLRISYVVNKGALGGTLLSLWGSKQAFVNLEIVDKSSWVTATLALNTLSFPLSATEQSKTTSVSFQVEENAPAFGLGYIKIKASVDKMAGIIEGFEQTFTLNFVPDYKPLINPSLPQENTKEIGPMDTAVFPIQVENLGNARTIVLFDVVTVPDDWNAVITSQVTLDEEKGSTNTAYLVIKPNKSFGYHFDEQTIKISMKPVKADDYSKEGTTLYESFLVQSRGFSTPGFESIFFIGALLVTLLLIKMSRRNK